MISNPQHIVILDAHTLNPGDLSWAPIEVLAKTTIYPRTAAEQVVERSKGAPIVLLNKTPMDAAAMRQLPALRYIGVMATGYNTVDIPAARSLGITVTNVAGYSGPSVAQHVFALLLALTNRAHTANVSVQAGQWATSADWCYWEQPIHELSEGTMGIVGMGTIGQRVGAIAHSMGMKVCYAGPRNKGLAYARHVSLETLFRQSDVISLHCPLTKDTAGLVNAKLLQQMKPNALLINTGRGGLVVEEDLANALQDGRIAGAGLDVLHEEPPRQGSPLIGAPNCLITPHQAWASQASRQRLLNTLAANIRAFLKGAPQNVVS